MWKELNNLGAVLDRAEKAVRNLSKRPDPQGRVTPFWATKRFVFGKGEFEPQTASLIHSAGRVTRVTSLIYSVQLELPTGDAFPTNFLRRGVTYGVSMRPSARGMVRKTPSAIAFNYDDDYLQSLEHASSVFDFEWAMSFGSSERNYAQRRDTQNRNSGGVFMSRNALGNPENDKSLLFSEKHPIVLQTNEFLTFTVRPTFSYLASPGPNSFLGTFPLAGDAVPEQGGNFVVNINYSGYRTFGDEVPE
jgi:hypothetical protein